ncbi:hypothetical protein EWH08_19680 [Sphingobium indicum]|uniref:Uncharacterized protein n=1 Tax=Sphingobium indicum TaxID=332055 RepID=A0A4Q4IT15_9SPHN|nr:hypothetical protein [Sphingobium indicum]NYI25003.1 hypothetical protein [Sphingobium indicum]RYL96495.1 hypothetical protein EWH08_19680 [Sphingobium indicum]
MSLARAARVTLFLLGSFSAAVSPYAVGIAIAQTSPAAVIAKEASPTWLTPRSLPQMSRDQLSHAQDGTAYLLTDWQVRANDTGYDSYLSTAEQKSAIRRRKTRPSCYMPGGVA